MVPKTPSQTPPTPPNTPIVSVTVRIPSCDYPKPFFALSETSQIEIFSISMKHTDEIPTGYCQYVKDIKATLNKQQYDRFINVVAHCMAQR